MPEIRITSSIMVEVLGSGKIEHGDLAATAAPFTAKEAEAIAQYRKSKRNFNIIDDLKKVPGIDPAKLESVNLQLEFQ